MTIDFWGLALQAVNVLILVWLLSRVFWGPVANAIAARQENTKAVIEAAQATQAKADVALAELTKARAGIDAERSALLETTRAETKNESKAALTETRAEAAALLHAAKATIEQNTGAAQKANAERASALSLQIAGTLLERLNGPTVQAAFLAQLLDAISAMPAADRNALMDNPGAIEIVTATDIGAEREEMSSAIQSALGNTIELMFVTDPNLIAGLELRSPHFVLHNSWQADLKQVQKAVNDAA